MDYRMLPCELDSFWDMLVPGLSGLVVGFEVGIDVN
jgi:hypothetical protein